MKLKPLILILPCLLIICFLFLVDKPLPEKKKQKTNKASISEEKTTQDIESATNERIQEDTVPIADFTHMKLVVGKTGSLEKGGYEPIYIEPDAESDVNGKLQFNCAVLEADEQLEEEWICVDLKDRGEGYVNRDSVELVEASFGSEDSLRNQIVQDALSYLGLRFVRYGQSLEKGIDCSNFVQQIYERNGIKIPKKPKNQRNFGQIISEEELEPGDLIYYDKANNGSGHVGLYIGDGFIINSSGHSGKTYPEGGVRIVRLLYKDRTSYEIVRILPEGSRELSEKEE